MPSEEWRPIPGYPDYEVSDQGRIRSLKKEIPRVLNISMKPRYPAFFPSHGGQQTTLTVHRAVAMAFIGPCPKGHEVRHLNGNSRDSRASNITYGTHSENLLDQVTHGTHPNAVKTHCPKGHEYTPTKDGRRRCNVCRRTGRPTGRPRKVVTP